MFRKCPRCGGLNVRRSSNRASKTSSRQIHRSPYRCRDCGMRFTLTSRRVYYLAAGVGVVIVAAAVGLIVSSVRDSQRSAREPAAAEIEGTRKLAESGDISAEHQLAQMYAVGDGVPKNEKEATKWLERAAEHGDAESQYEMGMALREGRGRVQDDAGALMWMQRAADAGNAQAQFELGRMYFVGAGIPTDKIKAYIWLNLAAAQGAVGAASLRDVVRDRLSPEEIIGAQADARRLGEIQFKRSAKQP
jgi:uncharacterized protein